MKKGEQDSPWASPLANYWTLARLDPLCKAGGKQEEEEKKKEQMAVRGKMDISGSQKGKSERVGRKRHGGEVRVSTSREPFPKFWSNKLLLLSAGQKIQVVVTR